MHLGRRLGTLVALGVVASCVAALPYLADGHPPAGEAAVASGVGDVALVADTTGAVDHTTLEAALADAGIDLPDGSGVYAVRLATTASGALSYDAYDVGEGGLYGGFWPASSVKLLAAVGALEYLADLGFTGAARITMDDRTFTVADVYEAAIADSSNEAYDQLVQIAGVDWLNDEFLTAKKGFPATVIQRSYTGAGVDVTPVMTIVEGSRRTVVPARRSSGDHQCADDVTGTAGNCSNLLELTESIRRVTLAAEIPEDERFGIAERDIAGLTDALLASEGFIEPAVEYVLGDEALVYNKPGYVPGDDCVDVALVRDTSGDRYLLAVETPEDGWLCPTLADIAAVTIEFLESSVA